MTVQTADLPASPALSAHAAYRARKWFGNLDGLRFICIALVLWHHYAPLPQDMAQIFGRGFLGVDFFFVLSGFLITTLLLRETEAKGTFSKRNFYIRRLLRIVPVYFFVVTAVAAYYIGVKGETQYLEILPYYYLFLSNFLTTDIPLLEPTWSLSVEEQYYLIWPFLMWLLPVRWLIWLCALLVSVSVANALGLFGIAPIPFDALEIKPPNSTYAPIIMGSAVAILLHAPRGFAWFYALAGSPRACLLWGVLLIAFMQFSPPNIIGWPNLVLHTLMCLMLAALVMGERTALSPFLTRPFVMRFGAVSYGIYLYHLIALDVVNRVSGMMGGLNPWLILIGYSLLSYVIAEMSFRTLEAFFQRFRPKD